MEAKELRIGNYLQRKEPLIELLHEQKYVYVTTSHIRDLEHYKDNYAFEPIPLTEEWLLKFGFESVEFYIPNKYDNGKLQIKKDERGFWLIACYNFVLIKHVHQLQNLYFALTGEELELIN